MFASYETDEEENRCNSNPISSWRQKKKQKKKEAGCMKMQKRLERTADERTSSTCAKSLKSSSCAKEIEEQANL